MVDADPVIGTNNPIEGKQGRDRVLTDDELRIIWQNCQDDDFGRIVRLLLLTACRRDEIGWLRWSEVDLTGSRLLLPAERTKPGRALEMPLVPTARGILEGAPKRLGREFVFGGSGGGFGAWSWCTMLRCAGELPRPRAGRCRTGRFTTYAGQRGQACRNSG